MRDKCPVCNSKPVDLLFSMDKLWCFNCKRFYDFKLKPGQKSIHIKGKIGESINNSAK